MLALINYRLRVTLNDSRTLTGQMLAFDRHLNLVLADCEEFRFIKQKKKKGPSANSTNAEESEELEMKRPSVWSSYGAKLSSASALKIAPGRGAGVPAGRGVGLPPPPGAPPPMMRGQPMSFPRPGGPPPGMAPPGMGMPPPPGFNPRGGPPFMGNNAPQASALPVKVPHLASTVDNLTSRIPFAIMLIVARSFVFFLSCHIVS
ncbi:hypothetical protein PSTT_00175 [Puccinia striiformis]|uniref:Sm protein B n=1 Tax=Puccinia striiformis TaxID=27350 RepID=A0A2S4W8A9_9BASI|nr:hypothetical protein PSTT_00175 [Puccinia striiformis]